MLLLFHVIRWVFLILIFQLCAVVYILSIDIKYRFYINVCVCSHIQFRDNWYGVPFVDVYFQFYSFRLFSIKTKKNFVCCFIVYTVRWIKSVLDRHLYLIIYSSSITVERFVLFIYRRVLRFLYNGCNFAHFRLFVLMVGMSQNVPIIMFAAD